MGTIILISKHLAGAVIAAAVLVISAGAEAKGPQGVGAGAASSHSAAPSSQGIGSNTWSQPPGWTNNDATNQGWNNSEPPGWDKNATGQLNGWDAKPLPPGIPNR